MTKIKKIWRNIKRNFYVKSFLTTIATSTIATLVMGYFGADAAIITFAIVLAVQWVGIALFLAICSTINQ